MSGTFENLSCSYFDNVTGNDVGGDLSETEFTLIDERIVLAWDFLDLNTEFSYIQI